MKLYIFFMKLEKHKILCYHYVMKTIYSVSGKKGLNELDMFRGIREVDGLQKSGKV
ncbi:hypothetical protein JMUB3936_0376 [Leptotrichia wadei]|uniref:Uncharacterized protein n=1 Tax=Leptotrichia wadei TaxID=157687 RepID=A0A510KQS6_9FUSO|nr:hypothetical protein JMUB3936_0376 [Leptotrichia wadei]